MIARWRQAKPLPIGIDVGAAGAKIIQIRAGRSGRAVIAAAAVLRPAATDADESAAALGRAIASKVSALKCAGRRCVVSIDSRLLKVRSVRLPRMNDEEIDKAMAIEGAERLGLPAGAAQIGWLRAGEVRQGDDVRDELILVGAETREIARMVDALAAAGLAPIAVEPSFVACARALGQQYRRQADQKHVRIAVDVGAKKTDVMVLRGDAVAFCKQLDWGGDRLNGAAAQKLGLEPDVVSEIRRHRREPRQADSEDSASPDPRAERAIFDAIRPALGELAHEVTLCMRYWMVTFRGERPEAVVLAGGEAEEPQLATVVQEATGIVTKVGRPLEGMALANASFPGEDRRGALARWTVAAGLSLRSDQSQRRDEAPERARQAAAA